MTETTQAAPPDASPARRSPFRRWLPVLVVLGAALLLVAVALVSPFEPKPPALTVREAYVGAGADPAGAYLVVDNDGGTDDLVGVTTDLGPVTLERRTEDASGQSVLQPAASLRLTGYEQTRLQPGDDQLLVAVEGPAPQAGGTVSLTLNFRRSAPITVDAEVLTYDEIGTRLLPPRLVVPDGQ